MATRMTSARFVGRSEQLAELEAALREAAEGRPSLALVGGESGVGKSRLADELIRHAREVGARVLSGDCVELGEDELPYAPLLTALRPLVRDGDPALDALAPSLRAALDAILPGLGEDRSTGEATQSRVFEALLTVLDGLAQDGPALLVIEDLHWADSSTRSFIGFLARSVCNERLLVVGTYRSDELHRRHPLRPLLAELSSDPYMRLIELPRFSPEELGEQLEGIVGDRPDAELVERVYSRSEGNALYAEEILAAGLDGRGALPPTLRDALMLRVERLSPRAQELIRWLACQPAADHVLVAAVAGLDARRPARRAARGGGEPHRGDRAATRATASATPCCARWSTRTCCRESGPRCTRPSRASSSSESRTASAERTSPLRWRTTGARPATSRARSRLRREPGLAAERVNAFAEAQALFERALSLWERVPDPEAVAGIEEFELLRHAAVAADQAGDPTRQEALLRRALAARGRRGRSEPRRAHPRATQPVALEPAPAGRLARGAARGARRSCRTSRAPRARSSWPSSRGAGWCSRALPRRPSPRARRSTSRARSATARPRPSRSTRSARRSATAARSMPACGYLRESLEIAREEGLEMEEGGAWINISDVLNLAGRTEEALEAALQGLETAFTQDWRTTDWLRLSISEYRYHLGDWDGRRGDHPAREPAAHRRHAPVLADLPRHSSRSGAATSSCGGGRRDAGGGHGRADRAAVRGDARRS